MQLEQKGSVLESGHPQPGSGHTALRGLGGRKRTEPRPTGIRTALPSPFPRGFAVIINIMVFWNAVCPQHLMQKCKTMISALIRKGGWDCFKF